MEKSMLTCYSNMMTSHDNKRKPLTEILKSCFLVDGFVNPPADHNLPQQMILPSVFIVCRSTLLSSSRSLFVLSTIYTLCLKERGKETHARLPCEYSVLHVQYCSTGGQSLFHVSMSSVLDKEQPVAETSSENMTSCTAAGGLAVRGSFFIVSP